MDPPEVEEEVLRQDIILREFEKKHTGLVQRDEKWKKSRGHYIGGSEMSALLGMSKYCTYFALAEQKALECVGKYEFKNNINCEWGNLFEPVITSYTELDFGSKVHGDEICVQVYPGHRNSPDGYIVIKTFLDENGNVQLKTSEHEDEPTYQVHSVILEFKCPLSRKPIPGAVPDNYRPQLWSGLSVSPMCKYGLFVDAIFKKCSLTNLDIENTKYDSRMQFDTPPIAIGFIGIYLNTRDELINEYLKTVTITKTNKFIDFGYQKKDVFEKFLLLCGEKKYFSFNYSYIMTRTGKGIDLYTKSEITSCVNGISEDKNFIGILPWKLFSVDYVPVSNEKDFEEDILPLIDKLHILKQEAIDSGNIKKFFMKLSEPDHPDMSIANEDLDEIYAMMGIEK